MSDQTIDTAWNKGWHSTAGEVNPYTLAALRNAWQNGRTAKADHAPVLTDASAFAGACMSESFHD